ncbi:hypothetical protein [Bosea sp. AS-1]|uniref:hypothetical protein n=1 Tax=Bosea sp. AS-1 TaxID=2015316 RepID=UPI000B76F144|nr:hypothetical protein [Bosea sp. AS-1]
MKTKPPFDGEIHAVSAKTMPDLNTPKREPGWFLGGPTPEATPTRDEAVREDPPRIWLEPIDRSQPFAGDERTWCEDKVWPEGDDQDEPTEYIRADLASAPAPASGVDAGWQTIDSAPEDEWLLVATTGGWVGEAMVLDGVWKWASGNVFHSDIVPLKWMPLPEHPEVAKETAACLTDAEQKEQAARCSCRGSDDYCSCQNVPDATTIRNRRRA